MELTYVVTDSGFYARNMAAKKSMKKSSSSNLELRDATVPCRIGSEETDLELPVDAGFISRPPRLSSTDYVKWCEEMKAALPQDHDKTRRVTQPPQIEEFIL